MNPTEPMCIQLTNKRLKLEEDITKLIQNFSQETGVQITEVKLLKVTGSDPLLKSLEPVRLIHQYIALVKGGLPE